MHTDPAREVAPAGAARRAQPSTRSWRSAWPLTLREQQVLARVERRAVARLEVDTRERPVLVPELEQDVHDLRGLAEFGELVFAARPDGRARRRRPGERAAHPLLRQGRRRQDEPLRRHRDPRGEARPAARSSSRPTPPTAWPTPSTGRWAPSPRAILPNLDAVEVDVNQELASHWGTIHEYLTRFMTFHGVDETVAEEIAILPGHGGAVQPACG